MRIAGETIGVRGAALLIGTAVTGIMLAGYGWWNLNDVPAGAGVTVPGPVASAPATKPSRAPSSQLSAQSYASHAYQVWPGKPSAAARAEETGLIISVRRQGPGIWVQAHAAGQPAPSPRYYPAGARVYVTGDDGFVVTNAQGRIVQ